jgi:hypothetical protein
VAVLDPQQVLDVERGLAEQMVAALLLERQQAALDRPDRGRGHPAILDGELLGARGDRLEHCAQVLQVEQQ